MIPRCSPMLRSSANMLFRRNFVNQIRPGWNTSLRRTLPLGLALGVGLGTGCIVLSQPSAKSKPLPHKHTETEEMCVELSWKTWEKTPLTKKETRQLYRWVTKLAPKRDIFKNFTYIIPIYKAKCNIGRETMDEEQFFRWIQFHSNKNFTKDEMRVWMQAFDLSSSGTISLNEFISVYVLIQTMEKKGLKKRDLFKWSKANFKAMDLDSSGYLDFDEVCYWIEFAIRAGYIKNKHPSGTYLSAEELGDLTLRKYDENFDGKISFEEFRSMFTDLLTGHFTEWHGPTESLVGKK